MRRPERATRPAPEPPGGAPVPAAKPPLGKRVRYAFDNAMARGPGAVAGFLGVAIVCVVVAFTALLLVAGVGPHNPISAVYRVFLHTIDTGSQANDSGTLYSALSLLVTLTGIFIFGTFIGILVTGMDSRLQHLRKGRSVVLERDHTLILGWSERVFTIIAELAIANESRRRPSVVILAERDKAEMEDAIRESVPATRNTRVICRTGSALVSGDLEIVNHNAARSVILLGADGALDPDADVIKAILALTKDASPESPGRHIVAEVRDVNAAHAARLAGGDAVVLINKPQTISRLIVQTSRQSGAAAVYRDILDFDGDEIYLREDDRLTGRTYLEAMLGYEKCAVIGLMHGGGRFELNPPGSTVVAGDDTIIALAEDDAVFEVAEYAPTVPDLEAIAVQPLDPPRAEMTLILGYNHRTPLVVDELSQYAAPGSRVDLVADVPVDRDAIERCGRSPERLAVTYRPGKTTERRVLDELKIETYDRVIVMGYSDDLDGPQASARSLVTLLHLRDIAHLRAGRFAVVSEVIDTQDTELTAVTGVDDVVVSDHVLSLLLTQIAENRHLADIFDLLFQADGPEIYMRPADRYVKGGPVSFATLVAAASRRAETAIGYRVAAQAGDSRLGVTLNPLKSTMFAVDPGDRLIVLAED